MSIFNIFSSPDTSAVFDLGAQIVDAFSGITQKQSGHITYNQEEIVDLNYVLREEDISNTPVRKKNVLMSQIKETNEIVKINIVLDTWLRIQAEARNEVSKKLDTFISTNYELISKAKELKTKSESAFYKAVRKMPEYVGDALDKIVNMDLTKYTPVEKPVTHLEKTKSGEPIVGKFVTKPHNPYSEITPSQTRTNAVVDGRLVSAFDSITEL